MTEPGPTARPLARFAPHLPAEQRGVQERALARRAEAVRRATISERWAVTSTVTFLLTWVGVALVTGMSCTPLVLLSVVALIWRTVAARRRWYATAEQSSYERHLINAGVLESLP